MGVPRDCLDSRERRNPHLDTSPRCPFDQGCQGSLDGRLCLQTIGSLTREVGSAGYLHLVRNHVSSRRSPGWLPHANDAARRSGR